MNRRSFVDRVLLGAVAGLYLTKSNPLGPFSSRGKKLSRIGLQLYTVRKELERDFEGTLAKVAALGFAEVEFADYYKHTPKQIKSILAANGLSAPSTHVSTSVLRGDLQETIEAARIIGHRYVVCAYLPAEERKSLDDYKRLIDLFNSVGERLKKAGIQFCYHNHDFEFAAMDGKCPYDVMLAETNPELVTLEMDLYWIIKAGRKPIAYFQKYPGRFPLVHVKDMDGTPKRFFTEVGRGIIDFKQIFARSDEAGIKHYFVEQDETPGSPFASIKISIDYLKRIQF
jgi:sugar phosphate isomerase/epimerase